MISNSKLRSQPVPLPAPELGHPVLCSTELQKPSELARVLSHFRSPFCAAVPSSPPSICGHAAVGDTHQTHTKQTQKSSFSADAELSRGWRAGAHSGWGGDGCGGTYRPPAWTNRAVIKEMEPHAGISVWQNKAQWLEVETREVQAGNKEQHLPHEVGQAVEKVTQRGCEGSITGGFQEWPGQSLEQLGLISQVTLLGAGGWTRDLLTSLLS